MVFQSLRELHILPPPLPGSRGSPPAASVRMLLACDGAWAAACPLKSHSRQPCPDPFIHRGKAEQTALCPRGGWRRRAPSPLLCSCLGRGPRCSDCLPRCRPGAAKGVWRFSPGCLAATPALGGRWALRGGPNASWRPVVPISIGAAAGEAASPSPASPPLALQAQLVLHLNKTIIKTIRLSQLLNHLIPKSIPWVI